MAVIIPNNIDRQTNPAHVFIPQPNVLPKAESPGKTPFLRNIALFAGALGADQFVRDGAL